MSECSALLTACLAQRTPYSLSERSALLTACLSAARTQSVGKLAFKKNAVRWQAGFQEERSSLTSCLTRRTQYCLWSCLMDASPSAPSPCNGEGWGKNHPGDGYKGRSVVKNGLGNRYKQDPFQGTLPVGRRSPYEVPSAGSPRLIFSSKAHSWCCSSSVRQDINSSM